MDRIKGKKKQFEKKKFKWELLPLQFILMILPLVIYAYAGYSGLSAYPWNSTNDFSVDVFLYGKMIVFTIVAALTLVLAVYKTVKMNRDTRKQMLYRFIPLFVYLFFVILSTICSENIAYSVFGAMDASEPIGVLTGYVIIAFYACIVIDDSEDLRQLTLAAVIGGAGMALFGVLQAVKIDPLVMKSMQKIYAGREFLETYGGLKSLFPPGQAYGTLYNPNYVGSYVTLYIPILVVLLFTQKTLWLKILSGASFVGLMVFLFASESRTGLLALFAVGILALFFLGRRIWKRWYITVAGIALVIVSFLVVDGCSNHKWTLRMKQMFTVEKSDLPVKGVDTTGNGVRVVYKDTEFTVMMPISGADYGYVAMEGDERKEITYDEERIFADFTLNNGDVITIQTAIYENCYAFGLNINGNDFFFTNQIVIGNYKFINRWGRLDECIISDNVFPGYERVASGRGYVWGRTIPLLLDNFLVGCGPDNFAIEFPQNDYVANEMLGNTIFTRPHNFFLQMGVQTGTLSLLAFLVFYAIYFIGSVRRYCFRKFEKAEEWIGFALFLCTVGFMIAGIANDSLIVVTPMFYVLLGAGMAVNYKFCPVVKKDKVKEEKGLE